MNKKKVYTGRDYLLVRLIQGVTKSGIHCDRKKEISRTACRGAGAAIEGTEEPEEENFSEEEE